MAVRGLDQIVKDIVTALKADSNVKSFGKILDRPPKAIEPKELQEELTDDDGNVRATIIQDPTVRRFEDEAKGKYWHLYEFEAIHLLQHNENERSHQVNRQEVQFLMDAIEGNETIFGVPHRPEVQRTATEGVPDLVIVGDRLAHQTRISFTVEDSDV